MRRLLPDSLAGWGLLIVIAALIVATITTLAAIAQSRATSTRMKGLFQLAERVSSVSRVVANAGNADRYLLAPALGDATLLISVDAAPLADRSGDEMLAELQAVLQGRLSRFGIGEVHVAQNQSGLRATAASVAAPGPNAGPFERALTDISAQHAVGDAYVVSARLEDGAWINFVYMIAAP